MINSKIITASTILISILAFSTPVFAHVVVIPKEVGIGATQDFTITVPSEKDTGSTTSVQLLLPPGLSFVTPIVQSGWTATVKTGPIPSGMKPPVADDGDVADSIATELDWTGGSIPSGQEAKFTFSAQVPSTPTELDWKVNQGYSDGSSVSWTLSPKDPQPKDSDGNPNFDEQGPYSKTMVINDLTTSPSPKAENTSFNSATDNFSFLLSGLAILIASSTLGLQFAKKNKK